MHELMELKEMLTEELEKYGAKGDLSTGDLEVVDKLAHSIKNLCKVIEAMEEESGEYSRRGNYYEEGGSSYRRGGGRSYYRDDGMDGGSSYRRGRGRNARRDSRGRYAREGGGNSMYYYEGGEDFAEQMKELMEDAPNEQVKQRMRQLMQDMQQM